MLDQSDTSWLSCFYLASECFVLLAYVLPCDIGSSVINILQTQD